MLLINFFSMNKNQHIVKHKDGWAVKGANNNKATSVHKTQREAIETGKIHAKNQKSELLIHGRDGKIREKNSYGKDSYPPKG